MASIKPGDRYSPKSTVYEKAHILTTKYIKCNVTVAPREVGRKCHESFISEDVEGKSYFTN